jgi:cation transport regulator ChaB
MPGIYEPPDAGDAPEGVKKILQDVYQSCREENPGEDHSLKEKCAKIAWSAVEEKYHKKDGEWVLKVAAFETAVKAASRLIGSAGDPKSVDYGYKWDVQIIEAGPDLQMGAIYPYEVLRAAVPAYEGAKVFALSQAQHDDPKHPYGKSVRDLVGWISGVKANAKGLEGKMNISKTASWLRDLLVDAWERGKQDLIGLSHDILAGTEPGSAPVKVREIFKVDSVDIVYDPIAGGKFLRMAAAAKAAGQKEATMFKELLAALKSKRPDLKTQIEVLEAKGDAVTGDEITSLMAAAPGRPEEDVAGNKLKEEITNLVASLKDATVSQAKEAVEKAQKLYEDTIRLNACSNLLINELQDSLLPTRQKNRIRKQFEGKVFEEADLKAAIKEEKEIVDELTGSGAPHGVGGLRMEVGPGEPEKLQAALDKLFGCDVDEKFKDVVAFNSLRAAYARLTGDPDLRGIPSREGIKLGEAFMNMMRLPAAYSSTSFSFALGNSMYRRLIKEYRAVEYREDALISYYRNAENFKNMEIIQVGYLGDVPDVTPETVDYQEITMPTDVEAIYAINQKGWILTVTRRVIMNDDLKTVVQLVSKMGRAHRRTHARRAWNKIINNATFDGDATALFDATHGNLGAVTLTNDATGITTLENRLKAMYAQTEQDSGEGLALEALYLWCPRTILDIAKALNSPWFISTNPHAGRFGANHERIVCNPLFTDVNDWGLIASGADVELLEAAYINGQREPEFFVADNPVVGQMFVADKIQYKSRHEYEFEIADFRGFDKSVA